MCGPHRHFAPMLPRTLHRIPKAVIAIATKKGDITMTVLQASQYRKR